MKYDHVDRANSAVRSGVGALETYEHALKNATDRGALVALSQGFAALATAAFSRAQVEATLALVEQQRIANLIALAESGRTTVNGARAALSGLYDGAVEDGSANMHIRADVAAALGIEQ